MVAQKLLHPVTLPVQRLHDPQAKLTLDDGPYNYKEYRTIQYYTVLYRTIQSNVAESVITLSAQDRLLWKDKTCPARTLAYHKLARVNTIIIIIIISVITVCPVQFIRSTSNGASAAVKHMLWF